MLKSVSNIFIKYQDTQDKKVKNYSSIRFIWLFFTFLSSSMITVGGFNYLINPYGIFNHDLLSNLNHEKPRKDNNDRLFKAVEIINIKPDVVMIGSSRIKQGMNPSNFQLEQNNAVYNLGINGPNMYEVKRYLKHAIANQPNMKTVIFGVDFFMFNQFLDNQPSFEEKRLETRYLIPQDIINTLFSLDALEGSWETVGASLRRAKTVNDRANNGFMPNRNAGDGNNRWRFESSIRAYYQNHNHYQLSEAHLKSFQEVVELCKDNNIELKIFISPSHATQWESIAQTEHWHTFEQWKRELVNITPVWDFSGYNTITTEPLEDIMTYYTDSSHYTESVGNLIIGKMYLDESKEIPEDFGILINLNNIEQHLVNISQDRQVWKTNNEEEMKLINEVYLKWQDN